MTQLVLFWTTQEKLNPSDRAHPDNITQCPRSCRNTIVTKSASEGAAWPRKQVDGHNQRYAAVPVLDCNNSIHQPSITATCALSPTLCECFNRLSCSVSQLEPSTIV